MSSKSAIQSKFKYIKRLLSSLAFLSIVSINIASGQVKVSETKPLSPILSSLMFERLSELPRISAKNRNAWAGQLQQALNNKKFIPKDESLLYLGLAVVNSFQPNLKYTTLTLLAQAKKVWPEITHSQEIEITWNILHNNFNSKQALDETMLASIAELLDDTALINASPEGFAFYRGIAYLKQGKIGEALSNFLKVPLESANYRRAKFFEGVIQVQSNHIVDAKEAFLLVLNLDYTPREENANFSKIAIQNLKELAVLNIARILYEQGQFVEAINYYRTLKSDSPYFYESLKEQAWSFFLGGYPGRAAGSQYAALTPFFIDKYTPDGYYLSAIINYWLCDYPSAQVELQKFILYNKSEGDSLKAYLNINSNVDKKKYAYLFENIMHNISPNNLGLGPRTIATLKSKPHIIELYKGIDQLISTRLALAENTDIPLSSKERIIQSLLDFENIIRDNLSNAVKQELLLLEGDLTKSLTQSRILYIDILTAQKDILVGKNKTITGNEFLGKESDYFERIGEEQKTWSHDKNEYWYDELGHFVFEKKSLCTSQ